MNTEAMKPFGMALAAYMKGDTSAELTIHRDDGHVSSIPVRFLFRDKSQFTHMDHMAIYRCKGHVLDIGAGTGLHSLVLQRNGLSVTSVDILPHAVKIMKQLGLTDVHCVDIFKFQDGRFDTLLMMGHGIGMVETLTGLDRFLAHAYGLLSENGHMLLDSLDVRIADDPGNLVYHEINREAGRYIGEIRMRFEFQGKKGPYCVWLHVDDETLSDHAQLAGWQCNVIHREKSGDYLAQLIKQKKIKEI